MQSGIDTLDEREYLRSEMRDRREALNTWVEIALLWAAVIVVIAFWR